MMILTLVLYAGIFTNTPSKINLSEVGKCWTTNSNEKSNILRVQAIGFVFSNDKIILTNPNCKSDHYRSTLSESDVALFRKRIVKSGFNMSKRSDNSIGFKARLSGFVWREREQNLFTGKILSPMMLSIKDATEAYTVTGGK